MDAERDMKQWRAIALTGAAACGLLTARLVRGRPLTAAGWLDGIERLLAPGEPAGDDDLFSETQAQQVIRRLEACESHLVDLEDRLFPMQPPERKQGGHFSADCPGNCKHHPLRKAHA
jgi:hypothetical protein